VLDDWYRSSKALTVTKNRKAESHSNVPPSWSRSDSMTALLTRQPAQPTFQYRAELLRNRRSSCLSIAMDISDFVDNVQDLSDLELATLLCLIAKEHCLFETADEFMDDLASELALVCYPSNISDLSRASLTILDRLRGVRPQVRCAFCRGLRLHRFVR